MIFSIKPIGASWKAPLSLRCSSVDLKRPKKKQNLKGAFHNVRHHISLQDDFSGAVDFELGHGYIVMPTNNDEFFVVVICFRNSCSGYNYIIA